MAIDWKEIERQENMAVKKAASKRKQTSPVMINGGMAAANKTGGQVRENPLLMAINLRKANNPATSPLLLKSEPFDTAGQWNKTKTNYAPIYPETETESTFVRPKTGLEKIAELEEMGVNVDLEMTSQDVLDTLKKPLPEFPVDDRTDAEMFFNTLGKAITPDDPNSWGGFMLYNLAKGVQGALGAVEGVTDFFVGGLNNTMSTITSLGGTMPNLVSKWFDEGADFTYDNNIAGSFGAGIDEKAGDNLNWTTEVSGKLYNIAGAILTAARGTKGLSKLAGLAASGASKIAIAATSGGQSAQQAYDKGANAMQAGGYGNVIGAIAAAIEGVSGGIPGFGSGLTDEIMGRLGKIPQVVKFLVNAVGEGGEGVLESVITPYVQRIYYDPTAKAATLDQLEQDFVYGAALSGIMQISQLTAPKSPFMQDSQKAALNTETTSTGEAGESTTNESYTIMDDSNQQEAALASAYDRVINEGRGVSISNEVLAKYTAINNNPAVKLINVIKEYYDNALKGTSVNVTLNGGIVEVKFENDGKKKSVGWRMSPSKAATFESMHQMFENAEYAYSELNRDVNESFDVPRFHYFVTNANVDGIDIPVKLQVRDLNLSNREETRYYTHTLQSKGRGSDSPGTIGNEAESSHGNAYTSSVDTIIPQSGNSVNTDYAPEGRNDSSFPPGTGAAESGFDPFPHFQNQKSGFHNTGESSQGARAEAGKTERETPDTALEGEVPASFLPNGTGTVNTTGAGQGNKRTAIVPRRTIPKSPFVQYLEDIKDGVPNNIRPQSNEKSSGENVFAEQGNPGYNGIIKPNAEGNGGGQRGKKVLLGGILLDEGLDTGEQGRGQVEGAGGAGENYLAFEESQADGLRYSQYFDDIVKGLDYDTRVKLNQWKTRPDADLYIKYKNVYDNPKYFDQQAGYAKYPGEYGDININGFVNGEYVVETLQPGTIIDRYGSNKTGRYFCPEGTPYGERALPPFMENQPYTKYVILKPMKTKSGKIAPWFEQPGGGKQFFPGISVEELRELGIIGILEY